MKFNKKITLLVATLVVGVAASVTAAAIPPNYGFMVTYYSDAAHSSEVGERDGCTGMSWGMTTPYYTRQLVHCDLVEE